MAVAGMKETKAGSGIFASKGKDVIFGIGNPAGGGSYLFAYRHKERTPFGVVGRFLSEYNGADGAKLPSKDGEKRLFVRYGPSGATSCFYAYKDISGVEKIAVLRAMLGQKGV